jgi:hypothetical protein
MRRYLIIVRAESHNCHMWTHVSRWSRVVIGVVAFIILAQLIGLAIPVTRTLYQRQQESTPGSSAAGGFRREYLVLGCCLPSTARLRIEHHDGLWCSIRNLLNYRKTPSAGAGSAGSQAERALSSTAACRLGRAKESTIASTACDAMTGDHSTTVPSIAGGAKTAAIMGQSHRLAAAQLQLRPGGATDSSCGRGTTILTTRAYAIAAPDHGAAAFQAKGS